MRFVTNMSVIGITVLFSIASLVAVCEGQCIRVRSGNSGQQPPSQTSTISGSTLEDLTTLLAIVRALEEKECPKSSINNAEEIILQLVNALVYATTHNVGCPKGGGNGGGGTNSGGGTDTGGGTNTGEGQPGIVPPPSTDHMDNGLIQLDLLKQANKDYERLLELEIAGKNILDVGLGHDKGVIGTLLNTIV